MTNTANIDFKDSREFADICGVNDKNLHIIERLLGHQVFSRGGTQLAVQVEDQKKISLFRQLISELVQHRNQGQTIKPSLIESVFSSLTENPQRIQELRNKSIDIPQGFSRIFPRSYNQSVFLDALNQNDLIFGVGPAGTGKTFLAVAHALAQVLNHQKRRLILTRPVVEAGESLGFLPGDLSQKLNPYLKPLYDAMDSLVPGEIINRLELNRVIEIAPLAYMRGRSLKDSYIILDEAQNTTREQMKMFLTRLGEGTTAVITGDITQIDLPKHGSSGLIHATKILKEVDGIHFSYFQSRDVVRSALVKKIIAAYENE
ncbi:PhoH family protein [Salinispira pacifica]|uniref:PhoH-like protein n=1 Tax=Salinispira pacifica TaxID=1307761 RepID=V5WHD7_9SPIO|nr:PhoH family protein [Salinispira pacifica]AHC15247.1 Phosphate starvation-inducible protein PhoH, predicted ATPase [Salinispira pacifica]